MCLLMCQRNAVAEAITLSVTREERLHSYVASGGPRWLWPVIEKEARAQR